MYETTALLMGILFLWVGVAYELQLVSCSLKTVSKNASRARLLTPGASVYEFCEWHVNQATPGLLNTCNCE